uniref:Uncharacterized protein n=1 Tax=Timema monikensis TaxID=170555 RepID=A0A7R9HN60_9NEOP|nr:unnamed protein product [Timema monikensis]
MSAFLSTDPEVLGSFPMLPDFSVKQSVKVSLVKSQFRSCKLRLTTGGLIVITTISWTAVQSFHLSLAPWFNSTGLLEFPPRRVGPRGVQHRPRTLHIDFVRYSELRHVFLALPRFQDLVDRITQGLVAPTLTRERVFPKQNERGCLLATRILKPFHILNEQVPETVLQVREKREDVEQGAGGLTTHHVGVCTYINRPHGRRSRLLTKDSQVRFPAGTGGFFSEREEFASSPGFDSRQFFLLPKPKRCYVDECVIPCERLTRRTHDDHLNCHIVNFLYSQGLYVALDKSRPREVVSVHVVRQGVYIGGSDHFNVNTALCNVYKVHKLGYWHYGLCFATVTHLVVKLTEL